jgi:hypothetical protein
VKECSPNCPICNEPDEPPPATPGPKEKVLKVSFGGTVERELNFRATKWYKTWSWDVVQKSRGYSFSAKLPMSVAIELARHMTKAAKAPWANRVGMKLLAKWGLP